MSPVRRLALTISDEVVRWASPGCKEWAEGLEREARIIESDWAALGWALGSMRVLLDRRAAPLRSLDEVPAATQKFVETTRWQAGFVLAMSIMQGLINLLPFFLARIILRPLVAPLLYLHPSLRGLIRLWNGAGSRSQGKMTSTTICWPVHPSTKSN
jgi:hypothetical protein